MTAFRYYINSNASTVFLLKYWSPKPNLFLIWLYAETNLSFHPKYQIIRHVGSHFYQMVPLLVHPFRQEMLQDLHIHHSPTPNKKKTVHKSSFQKQKQSVYLVLNVARRLWHSVEKPNGIYYCWKPLQILAEWAKFHLQIHIQTLYLLTPDRYHNFLLHQYKHREHFDLERVMLRK